MANDQQKEIPELKAMRDNIQAEAPEGKAVNWLPSPAGADFKMTVRMYLPVARARLYRGTVNLPRCP